MYLENGDYYNGSLLAGKRQGFGSLTEAGGSYIYLGEWNEDKRHGNGTLTSSDPNDEYLYDGEWVNG
jgi:hypothetical protein